jgi:hypothetical protein
MVHFQHKKPPRNRRGYSGIIATIFLVLVVLFLYFNVYTFVLNRNTAFQDTVSQAAQMQADRSNEQITILNVKYILGTGQIEVICTTSNTGALPVQLMSLWVKDIDANNNYNSTRVNSNLQPGGNMTIDRTLKVQGAKTTDTQISIWFVTARGNMISISPTAGEGAGGTTEAGSIKLDWTQFGYYDLGPLSQSPPSGATWTSNFTLGCTVPLNDYVIVGALLTNLDPLHRTITITDDSYIYATTPTNTHGNPHNIVPFSADVVSVTGNSYSTNYVSQTLNYGTPVMVYFAPFMKQNYLVCYFNMVLFGYTSSGVTYGQNIPFVALKFTSSSSITVNSSPAGAGFVRVDGNSVTTPYVFSWLPGSSHALSSTTPSGGAGAQYIWTSWSAASFGSSTNPTITYVVPNSDEMVTANYQTQYRVTFSYQISGGGSPSAPSVSYVSLGLPQLVTAGPSATVWVDSGSTYVYTPNPLSGSSGTERWYTSQQTGAILSSATISPTYYHQYLVTIAVNNANYGDITTPSWAPGTSWMNAGQNTITAAPAHKHSFSSWSVAGSITIVNPNSASTTATINGPGTITANFT